MSISRFVEALKNTPRTGWVQRGIPASVAEDIASHIFEVSITCIDLGTRLAKEKIINERLVEKATVLALLHDLPESVTGDLNRYVGEFMGSAKKDLEKRAFEEIGIESIRELYEKYSREDQVNLLVKICDRVSTYSQAIRYKRIGYSVDDIITSSLRDLASLISDFCRSIQESGDKCVSLINSYVKDLSNTRP